MRLSKIPLDLILKLKFQYKLMIYFVFNGISIT